MSNNLIYWERQDSLLCAVHCLNNLLQGQYYSEFALSTIALQLFQQEKNLLNNSNNLENRHVDDNGNFSIDVITTALKNFNIEIYNSGQHIDNSILQHDGFILNFEHHWIAIRRINNQYYNLNFLFKQGPQLITSEFYLVAYLAQLIRENYNIFIIKGKLPNLIPLDNFSSIDRINYFSIDEIKAFKQEFNQQQVQQQQQQQYTSSSTEELADLELNRVLQLSVEEEQEDQLNKAIALSLLSENKEK